MKKMILIAAAVLFAGAAMSAQTKFAHVDFNELLQLMPETDSAMVQMDAAYKEANDTYNTMLAEYQTKAQQFQEKQATWTSAVRDSKARELSDIEARINDFNQAIQQDMNQLNQALMAPIQQKATDVVNTLAKAKGVIYVFNSTSLLYIDETQSIDLTPEARTMLNIPDDKTIESVMAARQAQAEAAAAAQ